MNDLTTFKFEHLPLNTVLIGDEPWFLASDVTNALLYKNGRDAIIRHVDDVDVVKHDTPTSSGVQAMTYVNESGLYALIFSSKQEKAKEFKNWVTREVLPKIRKSGSYSVQEKPKTQLEVLAGVALGLVEQEKKINALSETVDTQQKQIEDLKESYSILPSRPANTESISYIRHRINKEYGLPARIINEVLYSFPYAPKPAGQVRNLNENANGSTYTVWNTSEVSKLFKRFTNESEMVTKTMAVNPGIDGRFKLVLATNKE